MPITALMRQVLAPERMNLLEAGAERLRRFGLDLQTLFPPAPSLAPAAEPSPEAPKETPMSLAQVESAVVNDVKSIGAFFAGAFAMLQKANAGSANAQTVQNAANQVTSASSAITAALPALAEEGVNLALGLIPGGAEYAPLADEFIDLVVAGLQAKKSTAPAS